MDLTVENMSDIYNYVLDKMLTERRGPVLDIDFEQIEHNEWFKYREDLLAKGISDKNIKVYDKNAQTFNPRTSYERELARISQKELSSLLLSLFNYNTQFKNEVERLWKFGWSCASAIYRTRNSINGGYATNDIIDDYFQITKQERELRSMFLNTSAAMLKTYLEGQIRVNFKNKTPIEIRDEIKNRILRLFTEDFSDLVTAEKRPPRKKKSKFWAKVKETNSQPS
jgi:hypothetical protein